MHSPITLSRPQFYCAIACLVVFFLATDAMAGTPRLSRLTPPGGQRGTQVEVEFLGTHLDQPRDVVFYESGISVDSMEMIETIIGANGRPQDVPKGTRVRVRLKIAADCPLGSHGIRLRTANGITDYRRFFVGPFSTVDEDEQTVARNDLRENSKPIALNTTVFGRLNDAPDVDNYRIEVKRGQRISAEVEAARLGVDRGIPDLHLTILDAEGKKLAEADDSTLFLQDPVLSIRAEKDGAYYVAIRHGMYNGTGEAYRLHIGTFARPTGLYPAGGQAGTSIAVSILGDPLGKREEAVALGKTLGDFNYIAIDADTKVPSPSPNTLRVSPFPNVLEAEPNDSPEAIESLKVASLPIAFNGIIQKPGDIDCFRFQAKKGDQYRFHALANALASPLDPVIWIKAVNAKPNAAAQRATDSRANQLGLPPTGGLNRVTHDPILEFTAPADGEYILGIEDERGEGGDNFVYRIEVSPAEDAIYTYIAPEPENQQQPQIRQSIVVPAGNRYTAQIGIVTTGRPYSGDLEIVGVNLPEGVTLHAPKLTSGMTRVPVVFEAAAGVKPQTALIDLIVRPVGGSDTSLMSGYRQTMLMNQYGNNDYYLHTTINKLALAVAEPAPFRVEVESPKSSLVQNGEMALKFRVIRSEGFTGPVTVQIDWKPTGVITATPVTIPEEETEGTYLLGAARNAAAGKYQLTLTATDGAGRLGYNDRNDRTYVASQLFGLSISEPHVEARIARTSIERGKTATLTCRLNHLQPFEGKAKATLARLPRGVELVEPMREIAAGDKEVIFTIRATGDALVGNYQGIVLDLTVTDNGQSVRQLSGSGILRIDTERGPKPSGK